ncbi:MAG TPA: caspase family protein [Syntrophales bacterium]|nr:caspase family protein [Syntrophales bacterium]
MRALSSKITLLLVILSVAIPSALPAAVERRTALIIGNSAYSSGPLKNPVNDATDMAATLQRLGFEIILRKDVRQQEMEESIRDFGHRLKKGGVALFFYAGHAIQINGRNYLIPIGARIEKETDAKYKAIDAEMVLDEMANAGNPMNIVILDACRDNPVRRSLRSTGRGLAIISDAPQGTFITYSTSPGQTAADGEGRNSPYTAALLKAINEPGLPIEQVFKKVRVSLEGMKQTPWELSSLKGEFYFAEGEQKVPAGQREAPPSPSASDLQDTGAARPPSINAGESRKQMNLALAQQAFNERKFAEPPGDNAIEYSRKVRMVDPEHSVALDLEKRATTAYENEAEFASMKNNEKRALEIYQRLFSLYPEKKQYLEKLASLDSATVPDISGVWYPTHVSGQAYFSSDGMAIYKGFLIITVSGKWSCKDPRKRIFSIVWNHGFTDVMTLSPDGQKLEGINNIGDPVSFVRNK